MIFDAAVVSIESRDEMLASNIETCDGDTVSAPGAVPSDGHKPTMLENYFIIHCFSQKLRMMSWELVL